MSRIYKSNLSSLYKKFALTPPTSIPSEPLSLTLRGSPFLMASFAFFLQDLSNWNLQFDRCQGSRHEWHRTSFPDVGLSYGNCHYWVFCAWHHRDTADLLCMYQEEPDYLYQKPFWCLGNSVRYGLQVGHAFASVTFKKVAYYSFDNLVPRARVSFDQRRLRVLALTKRHMGSGNVRLKLFWKLFQSGLAFSILGLWI